MMTGRRDFRLQLPPVADLLDCLHASLETNMQDADAVASVEILLSHVLSCLVIVAELWGVGLYALPQNWEGQS